MRYIRYAWVLISGGGGGAMGGRKGRGVWAPDAAFGVRRNEQLEWKSKCHTNRK